MYTRCPLCKEEIRFVPPENIDELPEDYRHIIRCPNCYAKLGVKLKSTVAERGGAIAETSEDKPEAPVKKRRAIYIVKNLFMTVFSLAFIIFSVLCYMSIKGLFDGGNEFNSIYNGIYLWELIFTYPEYFAQSFGLDAFWAFTELIPLFLFTFACINLIVSVICAACKKYGKIYNLIFGAIICALSVTIFFIPYINILNVAKKVGAASSMSLASYLKSLINPQYTTIFFAPAIGLAQFIAAIVFLFPTKRKADKKGDGKDEK